MRLADAGKNGMAYDRACQRSLFSAAVMKNKRVLWQCHVLKVLSDPDILDKRISVFFCSGQGEHEKCASLAYWNRTPAAA